MIRLIDRFFNNITMYRLVAYGLGGLALISLVISVLGRIPYSPIELIGSLVLLAASAYITNLIFAKVWDVPTNRETWLITALILFFVLQPVTGKASAVAMILAGALSSLSKFLIAPLGKHIFNPAAFAAAFVSLLGLLSSTWWVGTSALWPFTLILAVAVVYKIRRYTLALSFVAATVLIQSIQFAMVGQPLLQGLISVVTASPLLFLGGIMLTEPSTMPPSRSHQAVFGVIVAALFVLAPEFGPLVVYPEVALLIGNVYAFIVSPKRRYRLTLQRIEQVSDRVFNYVFSSDHKPVFHAGQYMELTLAGVPADGRGNRRTFTVASSPTEDIIQFGIKYYTPSSTFKNVFSHLQPGDTLWAGQTAGSFTLAGLRHKKLALIAGGIGITPFRSMVKEIVDRNLQADVFVLYMLTSLDELAYADVFREAISHGVRLITFAPNPDGISGVISDRITETTIPHVLPDYAERTFLISGPNSMVQNVSHELRKLNVHGNRIHTDYFSGY